MLGHVKHAYSCDMNMFHFLGIVREYPGEEFDCNFDYWYDRGGDLHSSYPYGGDGCDEDPLLQFRSA